MTDPARDNTKPPTIQEAIIQATTALSNAVGKGATEPFTLAAIASALAAISLLVHRVNQLEAAALENRLVGAVSGKQS